MKLYERKIEDLSKTKKKLKENLKLKEIRIKDLEKENNEMSEKISSKSIFESMGANYTQIIALQKDNSDLKSQVVLMEVI